MMVHLNIFEKRAQTGMVNEARHGAYVDGGTGHSNDELKERHQFVQCESLLQF
jgi:hypothetical protein